jgi:hypothetical protein
MDSQNEIKFEFKFSSKNLLYTNLPVQYEVSISSFKEKVEADPPTAFDDMVPFRDIEPLDFEISRYEKIPLPAGSNYLPIEEEKPTRSGCEHEYSI